MSCAPQPRPTAQPPWCIATARPSRCSHASQVHHMRMRVLASSLWHGKRPRQSSGMLRSTGQGQRRGVPRCRHITHGTRPNLVGLDKMDPSVPTANEVLPCNCGGDGGCGDGGRGGGADLRVRGANFFFLVRHQRHAGFAKLDHWANQSAAAEATHPTPPSLIVLRTLAVACCTWSYFF